MLADLKVPSRTLSEAESAVMLIARPKSEIVAALKRSLWFHR